MKTTALLFAAAGLVLGGGAIAAQQAAWNWGVSDDVYDANVESKAICRRRGPSVIPSADLPTAQQAAQLKGCDSEALYYGDGASPDYIKARQCAALEAAHGEGDSFFSGKTILMQVYANGYGVKRNIDLATALACEVEGAPAENDARVLHLQRLAGETAPFDVCDDITSGYAMGWCASRASKAAGIERDRQIDSVVKRLPAGAPFGEVRTTFGAFAEAHANNEVDLSGTERGAFVVEEEDRERDQFLKDLTRLAGGQWPGASHAEALAADAALNRSYANALKTCVESDSNFSTVRADEIRATQRLWLPYRDAYLRFAKVAAPALSQDAVLARLTRLRTAELDNLPCG